MLMVKIQGPRPHQGEPYGAVAHPAEAARWSGDSEGHTTELGRRPPEKLVSELWVFRVKVLSWAVVEVALIS